MKLKNLIIEIMKKQFNNEQRIETRKLRKISYNNIAELLNSDTDKYKDHIITYKELFNMLGFTCQKKYRTLHVTKINDAFDALKLQCRLNVVYNTGVELKFGGKEIAPLIVNRYKKEINAVKKSRLLFENRSDAYSGKMNKLLKAECKIKENLLSSMLSFMEMDALVGEDDKVKMIDE